MQICPSHDHERKDIKDWTVFDYLSAIHNEADRYEFNGQLEISKALNNFARSLLQKEVCDYNKRHEREGTPFVRLTLIGDQ